MAAPAFFAPELSLAEWTALALLAEPPARAARRVRHPLILEKLALYYDDFFGTRSSFRKVAAEGGFVTQSALEFRGCRYELIASVRRDGSTISQWVAVFAGRRFVQWHNLSLSDHRLVECCGEVCAISRRMFDIVTWRPGGGATWGLSHPVVARASDTIVSYCGPAVVARWGLRGGSEPQLYCHSPTLPLRGDTFPAVDAQDRVYALGADRVVRLSPDLQSVEELALPAGAELWRAGERAELFADWRGRVWLRGGGAFYAAP